MCVCICIYIYICICICIYIYMYKTQKKLGVHPPQPQAPPLFSSPSGRSLEIAAWLELGVNQITNVESRKASLGFTHENIGILYHHAKIEV